MTKKQATQEKVEFKDKIKSSYYLDKNTEQRIVEIYIKRMQKGDRPRKSQLIDEAVELLYSKEFKK